MIADPLMIALLTMQGATVALLLKVSYAQGETKQRLASIERGDVCRSQCPRME